MAFDDKHLPGADGAIKAAKALVGHFSASTQSLEKLLQTQQGHVERPLCLIQDVATRWWSTFAMCERLLLLKLFILILLPANPQIPHLTDLQWKVIEALCALLRPFMIIQKFLEGQKYVTVSLIPYLIHKIRVHLETSIIAPNIVPEVEELLQSMLNDFNIRWGSGLPGSVFDEHKTLGPKRRRKGLPLLTMQAAALDPRTKGMVGIPRGYDQEEVLYK